MSSTNKKEPVDPTKPSHRLPQLNLQAMLTNTKHTMQLDSNTPGNHYLNTSPDSNLTTMPLITSHPIAQLALLPLSSPSQVLLHTANRPKAQCSLHHYFHSHPIKVPPQPVTLFKPPSIYAQHPLPIHGAPSHQATHITPGVKTPNVHPKCTILHLQPNQPKSHTLSYNFNHLLPILNPLPPKTTWTVTPFSFSCDTSPHQQLADVWGHSMDSIAPSTTLHVLFQNPNGIKPHVDNMEFMLSLQECNDKGTSIIGLMKTNLNWSQFQNHDNLCTSMRKLWQHHSAIMSSSSKTFHTDFQPREAATMATNSYKILSKGTDPFSLGCWSWITLQGCSTTKLTVITAYHVCNQCYGSGECTAYQQQHCILSHTNQFPPNQQVDPCHQCILDLQSLILNLHAQQHEIILLIDTNK